MAKKIESQQPPKNTKPFVFGRENYILLAISFGIILVGYVLMSGGAQTDPKVFNEEAYNTTRITVAPIVILLGFTLGIFAILRKPKA